MLKYLLPLLVFVVLLVFLLIGLKLDPREVPSPLINKPLPAFTLPRLERPETTFHPDQMKGKVWLLNVWASWCVACRAEHPVLNRWARESDVNLVGLNYKDEIPAAKQWLAQLGNPYLTSIIDADGRVGIDWGVYGVPETFLIDKRGIIRYKHIGPLTMKDVEITLNPLLRKLAETNAKDL